MELLYLFVETDGKEYISNIKPFRTHEKYADVGPLYEKFWKIEPNQWATGLEEHECFGWNLSPIFDGVQVPKGTIEKLTGKTLVFNDEPIEIIFEA